MTYPIQRLFTLVPLLQSIIHRQCFVLHSLEDMSDHRALFAYSVKNCTFIEGVIPHKKSNSSKKSVHRKGQFGVKIFPYINALFEKSKSFYMVE